MAPSKLHGRAFYQSIGSPKHVLAPMVDQSEFAWRLLTRSFLPPELRTSVLCYSPMLHAKLYAEGAKYRQAHFEPVKPTPLPLPQLDRSSAQSEEAEKDGLYLDGNATVGDRPLFVQFCANDPEALLEAAKIVQPYCDAVDLNLGCPQGIAKRGHYGAFLQEDWQTVHALINILHRELDIPVTAKMRILETRERTLEYAKMILNAGASIITVHGRQREQKGHNTGLADWSVLRYLREQLPSETVIFANGNVLQQEDLQKCLGETRADGVMTAEGNLYDPSIFATPPAAGEEGREYWRGRDGKGGYRADAVLRRYLDIIHKHVLSQEPPSRAPLFLPSDPKLNETMRDEQMDSDLQPPTKRQKREEEDQPPDDTAIALELLRQQGIEPSQAHLLNPSRQSNDFQLKAVETYTPSIKQKGVVNSELNKGIPPNTTTKKNGTNVSHKHEKCNNPNLVAMQAHCFHILRPLVSKHHKVRDALARCRAGDIDAFENVLMLTERAVAEGVRAYERDPASFEEQGDEDCESKVMAVTESSKTAVRRCKRPYWVCQPYVRPLPKEALEKGSLQLSKKEKKRLAQQDEEAKKAGLAPEGKVETVEHVKDDRADRPERTSEVHLPRDGLVCG